MTHSAWQTRLATSESSSVVRTCPKAETDRIAGYELSPPSSKPASRILEIIHAGQTGLRSDQLTHYRVLPASIALVALRFGVESVISREFCRADSTQAISSYSKRNAGSERKRRANTRSIENSARVNCADHAARRPNTRTLQPRSGI